MDVCSIILLIINNLFIKLICNKIFNNLGFLSLLQDLVDILKPFLDATELLSGSKYTTLSFVYPTMYYLINKFAPTNGESDDDLYDLVYGIIQSEEPETSDLNNEIDDVNRGNNYRH